MSVVPRRYAGVYARHQGRVVLVREEYPAWGGEFWNVPSGRVEDGESAAEGAARELAEETGLVVQPEELVLVSTTVTTHGAHESQAWNHTVEVASPQLLVADPDGLIREARWFELADAVEVLSLLPYPPLAGPAIGYLTGRDEVGRHWTYQL